MVEEQVFTQIMARLGRIEELLGSQANSIQADYHEIKTELGEIKTSITETKVKQDNITRRVEILEEKNRWIVRTTISATISAVISIFVALVKLL